MNANTITDTDILSFCASRPKPAANTVSHPDAGRPMMRTDMGNGSRLAHRHGASLRYIHEFKKWIVFHRGRWLFDEDGAVMRLAKDTARSIFAEAARAPDLVEQKDLAQWAATSQSLARATAMIELAKSEPGIPIASCQLDRDPFLLGVENGVVDLRTGQLRQARRDDYITKLARVEFKEGAGCPTWEKFLGRIFSKNVSLIEFMQRALGYSLSGDTGEQCLFLAHGGGANGKSTMLDAVRAILGDYASTSSTDLLMTKQAGAATNDVARLRGARLVATIETEDGRRMAEGLVKQLTGGDMIAARFLFAEFFEFKPAFKIWLAANHKPVIRGDDYAIWRRIRLIPFNVTIPPDERNKTLTATLIAEAPGILQWMIRGCLDWQRIGLMPPPEVLAATEGYKNEMDLLGQWIAECCLIAPHANVKGGALYANYKRWAQENGGYPLSNPKFAMKLVERGFRKETSGTVTYYGIGILEGLEGLEGFSQPSPSAPRVHGGYGNCLQPSKPSGKGSATCPSCAGEGCQWCIGGRP
ncbi:MAG: phage/plasmid primase, P4 family [Sulfuritalea sp.]|nr:phage/plasmid primase, P4 family [Sulfuritalea sp.]